MAEKKQKALGGEFEPNPARFRKASQPHETPEAMSEAVRKFYDEVGELRVKYQISNLLVVWTANVLEADGHESSATGMSGYGNQQAWESMAACAYGAEKQKREELTRKLLSGSVKYDAE